MRHWVCALLNNDSVGREPGSNPLRAQFLRSLYWNAFNACLYQGILTIHYAALFYVTDSHFFGTMGSLFSLVFLLATMVNMGLDGTLSTFFTRTCVTKREFRLTIMRHIRATIGIGIILGGVSLTIISLLPPFSSLISVDQALILGIILVCEGIKKSLRMILQLSFRANIVAYIENTTVCTYVSWVWIGYCRGIPFSFITLFMPMVVCWTGELCAFSFFVYRFYQKLPLHMVNKQTPIAQTRFVRNRFFNLLNQVVHQLFSSNFLVPFFALHGGFALAGLIKLTCYLSYGLTSIIQKMIGFSTSAFFAQFATEKIMRQDVGLAHRILFGIIACLLLIGVSIILTCMYLLDIHARAPLALLFLIFFIQLSENFFTAYERLLIVKEHTSFLVLLNGGTTGIVMLLLHVTHQAPLVTILIWLLLVRVISFYFLHAYAQQELIQKPSLKPATLDIDNPSTIKQEIVDHPKKLPSQPTK
jgi:hypothetical protein